MPKLNEILAIEKSINARNKEAITELHKASQKPENYDGFSKTYQPKTEGGEQFPDESKKIVLVAEEVLNEAMFIFAESMDTTATKDFGNVLAKGDVELATGVSLKNVPVPHLLYLEKQLVNVRTFIDKLPVLDETETWKSDAQGIYKTEPTQSIKTAKEQRPIVLYDATDKHPAQTQLITQDVTVGTWTTTKSSARITRGRKKELVAKVETAIEAVKTARERANSVQVTQQTIGSQIMQWILS